MPGHDPEIVTEIPDAEDVEEKIAQSIIPYSRSDARARYLGLRASGFTVREALKLIGYAKSTLSLWRKDSQFLDYEQRLPEYKKELALEYANLEFIRNYRLVMEKDVRVLRKSLNPEFVVTEEDGKIVRTELPLSKQDQEYLIKMRTFYTPQQLQVIETLVKADKEGEGSFDLTKFVIEASRTEQRIRIESKKLPAITSIPDNGGESSG